MDDVENAETALHTLFFLLLLPTSKTRLRLASQALYSELPFSKRFTLFQEVCPFPKASPFPRGLFYLSAVPDAIFLEQILAHLQCLLFC